MLFSIHNPKIFWVRRKDLSAQTERFGFFRVIAVLDPRSVVEKPTETFHSS